jgi:hypothetical protein
MMKPLLALPFSHATTWLVASTVINESAVLTGIPVWTGAPGAGTGAVTPFTVPSNQAALAAEMSIAPAVLTSSTKIRSVAELTLAPVVPGASFDRSNWSRPSELLEPPMSITGSAPYEADTPGLI